MVRTGTLPDEAAKPGAEAVIFHDPVRRPMMEYRPRSSVVAVNDDGEALGFSAVIVAPFKGWLFWSLTVPPMRPVWAIAGAAATKSAATKAAAERNVFESRIACISLCKKHNRLSILAPCEERQRGLGACSLGLGRYSRPYSRQRFSHNKPTHFRGLTTWSATQWLPNKPRAPSSSSARAIEFFTRKRSASAPPCRRESR